MTEFICNDPNCPHCAYNENAPLISDEEIVEMAWKYNPVKKLDNEFIRAAYIAGAEWMREQYEK